MRNGYKSHRGRAAIARRVQFGGPSGTNGIMPGVNVTDQNGVVHRTSYYGGNKKGGSAPRGTGFMVPFGQRAQIGARAQRPEYFFKFTELFNFPKNAGPSL